MSTMMKAAVVRAFGKPLVIEDVPVPVPGPGEILVKVKACGVCHTDLHAADGDWPVKPDAALHPRPRGRGPRRRAGPRRAPTSRRATASACLAAQRLQALRVLPDRLGDAVRAPAQHRLQRQRRLRRVCGRRSAAFAARLPASVDFAAIAPILCAGVTTYKGLKETEAQPGEWVVISGIGGLGHVAVQYAKAMGLNVVGARHRRGQAGAGARARRRR